MRLLLTIGLVILYYSIYCQDAKIKVLEEYRQNNNLSNKYGSLLYDIIEPYTKNTRLEGKIHINEKLQEDGLNIYIIEKDPKEAFINLDCNCAYLGVKNTIVCDSKIIEYAKNWLYVDFGPSSWHINAIFNDNAYYFLLQWIIGHEIGHLILKHKYGLFTNVVSDATITNLLIKNQEAKADEFSIKRMPNTTEDHFVQAWLGISSLLSTTYPKIFQECKAGKLTTPVSIEYNPKMHPPWISRFVSMKETLFATFPDLTDREEYWDCVKSKFKLIPTDKSVTYKFFSNKTFYKPDEQKNKIDTETIDWNYRRGKDFFLLSDFENSQIEFQEILKKSKNNDSLSDYYFNSNYHLGIIALYNKNYTQAIEYFSEAQKTKTGSMLMGYLATAYRGLNKPDSVYKYSTSSIKLNKHYAKSHFLLAEYYLRKGQKDSANYEYLSAVVNDYGIRSFSKLIYYYLIPEDAIKYISGLSGNFEKSSDFSIFTREYMQTAISNQYQAGNNFTVIELIKVLVKNERTKSLDEEGKANIGTLLNFKGMCYHAMDSNLTALAAYREAILYDSTNNLGTSTQGYLIGQSMFNIGNLHFEAAKFDSAIYYYKKSIFWQEKNIDYLNNRELEIYKVQFRLSFALLKSRIFVEAFEYQNKLCDQLIASKLDKDELLRQIFEISKNDFQIIHQQFLENKLSAQDINDVNIFLDDLRAKMKKNASASGIYDSFEENLKAIKENIFKQKK